MSVHQIGTTMQIILFHPDISRLVSWCGNLNDVLLKKLTVVCLHHRTPVE